MTSKKEILKNRNFKFVLLGIFFLTLSSVIIGYFLPFFLKEKGLTILQIGFLFSLGLALGSFVFSVIYSNFLKKIKLKSGLNLSALFGFLQSFFLFLIPTSFGIFISKLTNVVETSISSISTDVAIQHNIPRNKHRKIGALNLISASSSLLVGLVLAYLLIQWIGFRYSFLIFALLSLPAFYFYSKVSDKTRFKSKKITRLPKISFNLKLVIFSEILYWLALSSSFALVITFLVTDLFSESIFWITALFVGLYASIVLTTLFTQKYLDRFNLLKTSIFGMFILFLSALLIIFSKNIYLVLVAMILEGIGAGIWVPSKLAVYWKLTGKELREKVSGYLFGWRGFVNALGPLLGGFLVTFLGILAPFYFRAILSLFIIFVYYFVFRKS